MPEELPERRARSSAERQHEQADPHADDVREDDARGAGVRGSDVQGRAPEKKKDGRADDGPAEQRRAARGPAQDRPGRGSAARNSSVRNSSVRRRLASLGARNPLGPTFAERLQNLAGEASADAAHALLEQASADADSPAASAAPDPAGPGDRGPDHHPPAPAPLDLTAAAFFDVDNTMVHGASIIHFARGLAARDYIEFADMARFGWQQVKFRVTGRENSDDVASGKEKALAFIAGREAAEFARLGEEIYDEILADKIWEGTRALAQRHLDAGQQVWLVTATPLDLAQVIAKRLGLTGALGTVVESEDGVFTGRLVGDILHGQGKAHAIRALAVREGLDLKRCTAYSDSHNDLPMLSAVGTAVAVNPDADLREVARNRGWEIQDFRTGRKAARIGVPTALALGAAGGAAAAALGRR